MSHVPTFIRDSCGRPTVHVPLSNSDRCAVLDENDYRRVVATIGNTGWYLNGPEGKEYVRAYDSRTGKPITVCRVVLGEPWRTRITYRNGNRHDLRCSNLHMERGSGGVAKRRKGSHREVGQSPPFP